MKKTLLFTISVLLGLIFFTYPEITKGKENGSPGGKTNSPIDGNNCTGCHNTQLNNGQGSVIISSDMQNNEYVPGETYTITVTALHQSFITYGFELTAENGTSKSGSFIILSSATTKLVNGGNAVTHTQSGTLGSATKTWTVDWTAPGFASSTGTVNFYVCAVNGNGDGDNSGDEVHTNIYTVNEQQSTSIAEHYDSDIIKYINNEVIISTDKELNSIRVYDINGKLIKITNSDVRKISTSEFKNGIYIIELIENSGNKITKKINIL